MGCTASKLDNEDTVRRCKERRRLIKDAVFARHHLAAAHSDYCRSLRITGSALSDFASGEPLLLVSPSTPSVLLHPHTHPPPSPTPSFQPPSLSPTPSFKPPPPIRVAPPAKSSSPTIATSDLPHILSGSSGPNLRKKERAPKLPHILSDTSVPATPQTGVRYEGVFAASSNYDSTPSQASSVWNWENFYPPSPPGSDFFARPGPGNESKRGYGDGDNGGGGGGEEREREEVHCSEWGDHYATTSATSSSETDDDDDDDDDVDGGEDGDGTNAGDGDDERETRSEISELPTSRSGFGPARTPSVRSKVGWGLGKLDERYDDEEGMRWKSGKQVSGSGSGSEEMRIVVRHKDLKEIVFSLKDYFDMAATAGDQVSEMLETGRAQLDRSFRQLKKTVYHSSGVLSSLSSSWSSKPPLAVKYRLDAMALEEPGGPKSLCSTLERLLAWEKKLYEEVKAREGVKIEHEKKLATLQSQEYKGEDEIKLDKTKASIKKLQSLIIVTSQAVNTTSSAIVGLRDSDLVPQIVELCHGMMYMWKSMNQFHELQNQIVQQVRGLINQQVKGDSTSELHRQATRELESAISAWHSSFCRLIKYQRDFIRSLHGWFKLTLLPVEKEATTHMMREPSDSFAFVEEWKLALDRLPDTVASEAIKSFVNVVHVISVKQSEEFKVKKRTETVSKELEKKASALRNIEKKYYHSYSMVGVGFPDTGPDNGLALDARDPLAEKKSELSACQRRVEEEIMKHAKAVEVTRAMTLNNIQTGLPGVFQALTSFSSLFMEALAAACMRSYSIK